jgi:putative (di)nucleoside polyphosphate hydrolase
MPQGGIDDGEAPAVAALRELYEETNVRSVAPLGEMEDWLSYDIPTPLAGLAWKGRYTGQRQKWFAMRFTGEESEIDVEQPAGGAHKPEFGAWRWERLERVPKLIVPFKRAVYEKVADAFARFAAP